MRGAQLTLRPLRCTSALGQSEIFILFFFQIATCGVASCNKDTASVLVFWAEAEQNDSLLHVFTICELRT